MQIGNEEEMIDETERKLECRINKYDKYLNHFYQEELVNYFKDFTKEELIAILKDHFGNDGKDDCNFEE